MGSFRDEFLTELEYLNLFSIERNTECDWLIMFIIAEADKRNYTLESFAKELRISVNTIRSWMHDPDLITIKDIVKLELFFNISLLEIVKNDDEYNDETISRM